MERHTYQRIEIRPLGWREMLALAAAVTLVLALVLVFGLLFLLLLPVVLVAGLIARWWLGRELRKEAQGRARKGTIEAEYEVVEVERIEPPGRGWGSRR
jgi:hypothetical protein